MKSETSTYVKYKVKDLSLAAWGRKEIALAEAEMPGEPEEGAAEATEDAGEEKKAEDA